MVSSCIQFFLGRSCWGGDRGGGKSRRHWALLVRPSVESCGQPPAMSLDRAVRWAVSCHTLWNGSLRDILSPPDQCHLFLSLVGARFCGGTGSQESQHPRPKPASQADPNYILMSVLSERPTAAKRDMGLEGSKSSRIKGADTFSV